MLAGLRQTLGETRYRVALLRWGQDLTAAEIGRRLKISRQAADKHLARIQALLPALRAATAGGRHRVRSLEDVRGFIAAAPSN